MTPLASISVSAVDATSGPDLSVAASISGDSGIRLEIRNPSHALGYTFKCGD